MNKEIVDFINNHPHTYTIQEVADLFSCSYERIRGIARRKNIRGLFRYNGKIVSEAPSKPTESKMRDATEQEQSRIERLLIKNGYRPQWGVSWVHLYDGDTKTTTLLRNPQEIEYVEREQQLFLESIRKQAPKVQKRPVPNKNLAIPCNFDVHIGKLCEVIRTGRDYTPDVAISRVLEGMTDQVRDFKHFGVTDVLIPMGNDIVHVDNNNNSTTSGTHQDTYGSVESQIRLAAELYIRVITEYAKRYNVWLCHVHSNHDRVAGWSVSQIVAAYFHNHSRVSAHEASMSQVWRKYFVFGNSLIMFHHGESKEEKLLGAIKQEAGSALAQVNRIYCYQGHTHHKTVSKRGMNTEVNLEKDHSGVTVIKSGGRAENILHVETIRSPSEPDDWHGRSLFLNLPAVETFIHTEHSQKHRLTHWF